MGIAPSFSLISDRHQPVDKSSPHRRAPPPIPPKMLEISPHRAGRAARALSVVAAVLCHWARARHLLRPSGFSDLNGPMVRRKFGGGPHLPGQAEIRYPSPRIGDDEVKPFDHRIGFLSVRVLKAFRSSVIT